MWVVNQFMDNWDLDGNGTATVEELREMRASVFLSFDSNEDGALDAGEGHAGHRPRGKRRAEHIGHLNLDAAHLHGVDVVDHHPAIFSVIVCTFSHAGTKGRVETRPLRASEKFCLNSPAFRLLWTFLT